MSFIMFSAIPSKDWVISGDRTPARCGLLVSRLVAGAVGNLVLPTWGSDLLIKLLLLGGLVSAGLDLEVI